MFPEHIVQGGNRIGDCMDKLTKIEELNSKVKITLQDGSTITGVSWGITPAEDDDGEDLGYDLMAFLIDETKTPIFLKEDQIKVFEKV